MKIDIAKHTELNRSLDEVYPIYTLLQSIILSVRMVSSLLEKRISMRYSPVKSHVFGGFWSDEKMDFYQPELGTGIRKLHSLS